MYSYVFIEDRDRYTPLLVLGWMLLGVFILACVVL
jgi:hypothetical protein